MNEQNSLWGDGSLDGFYFIEKSIIKYLKWYK